MFSIQHWIENINHKLFEEEEGSLFTVQTFAPNPQVILHKEVESLIDEIQKMLIYLS
jgi:hypothetical protein